ERRALCWRLPEMAERREPSAMTGRGDDLDVQVDTAAVQSGAAEPAGLVRFPWPLVAGGLLLLLLLALGAGLYANRNLRSPAGVETPVAAAPTPVVAVPTVQSTAVLPTPTPLATATEVPRTLGIVLATPT